MKQTTKIYSVRYQKSNGEYAITGISNGFDLRRLIKSEAITSIIESKMSEDMPISLHNLIGKHNSNINKVKQEIK